MKIADIKVVKCEQNIEISADMNGYRLWYRFPSEYNISATGDPFMVAGFFPAMSIGERLEIEKSVSISPKLVKGIMQLQDIFSCWNPILKKFKIIGNENILESSNSGVTSFYSGGIDGLYTLKMHKDEITHLVYINGFDFEISPEVFEATVARHSRTAVLFNKTIIPVETNFFSFIKQFKISRPLNHGSCLASVAIALGFPKTYIPATYSYNELHPWGSHPLTDPLWSTERSQIIHDTCIRRSEKTRQLVKDDYIRNNLIVCWYEPNQNCCKCGKCLRTMITLEILGLKSLAFPKKLRIRDIEKLKSSSYSDLSYFYDNLNLAIALDNKIVANALKKSIRRSALKIFIKDFDRRYLKGFISKVYGFIRYGKVTPQQDFLQPTPWG